MRSPAALRVYMRCMVAVCLLISSPFSFLARLGSLVIPFESVIRSNGSAGWGRAAAQFGLMDKTYSLCRED